MEIIKKLCAAQVCTWCITLKIYGTVSLEANLFHVCSLECVDLYYIVSSRYVMGESMLTFGKIVIENLLRIYN